MHIKFENLLLAIKRFTEEKRRSMDIVRERWWSELDVDLLTEIMNRLQVADFIRAGAACKSWRSCIHYNHFPPRPLKPQIPWLMLSSPDEPEYRFFHDLTADRSYKFHLPNIKHHNFIGSSSDGDLISVDEFGQIHATNPITRTHTLFPDPTKLPCFGWATRYALMMNQKESPLKKALNYYYWNLITADLDRGLTAVLIHGFCHEIAFARATDDSWTRSELPFNFEDAIFHKGLLYAAGSRGELAVIDFGAGATADPVPIVIKDDEVKRSMCSKFRDPRKHEAFMVFKLDEETFEWIRVKSFDDDAVAFVGFNRAVLVSSRGHPDDGILSTRKNSIYFTYDNMHLYRGRGEVAEDVGVFHMEDGNVMPLDHIALHHLKHFTFPPPIWFTPAS